MGDTNKKMRQYFYQKGYTDGYKRSREHYEASSDNNYQYMRTVAFVLLVFVLFIVIIGHVYGYDKILINKNKDCLLDLSSIYYTEGCLQK